MIFINPHKCCTFVTEKSCLTSNANLCIIQKLKLLPSHYLYWGETLVNRSFLAIRHILAEFLRKIAQKTTFLKVFPCYEKRLHSPFLPLLRQNKEVWVSGLNQHTANVPNRKVPKVRILLLPHIGSLAQLDQSTTLRTSVSGVRVSHESQHWRFGRVGLLHRSWKPAGGNVSKVRIL